MIRGSDGGTCATGKRHSGKQSDRIDDAMTESLGRTEKKEEEEEKMWKEKGRKMLMHATA